MTMKFMFITNDSGIAQYAEESGVERVFVDLEVNGKQERQGHLNTLISQHSMVDVGSVKSVLQSAELLVRLNPLYDGTQNEVNQAIALGADLLMLPMFYSAKDLSEFSKMVAGRAGVIPLVETKRALLDMASIVKVRGVSEIYIGLNDLHLDAGLKFMFEPLVNGMLEAAVIEIKRAGLPFGFGGVARVGEGLIPGELVLAEHVRLGSERVILSRTFHRSENSIENLKENIDLGFEIQKLNDALEQLRHRGDEAIEQDRRNMKSSVDKVVRMKL